MSNPRSRVDVRELLRRLGIRCEERGGRLWALCPNPEHDDRDPSWFIRHDPEDERHGGHHCFSCGFGGWPVQLVEAVTGLDREGARDWLRSSAKLSAPLSVRVEFRGRRARQFELPPGVRFGPLAEWPAPARRYAQERGLTPGQVKRWGVGYAADGRLRGRLVFPVRDGGGKLLSYTSRTFIGAARKCLEPERVEGASPGAVFGEQWWPALDRRESVVVAEAVLDALAVERAVGGSVAGLLGSSLHPGQVSRLSTFGRLVIATDNDEAGQKVAEELRGLRRWCQVVQASVPAGEDCASLPLRELATVLQLSR